MILAVDVDYRENNYAVIAGVIFNNWQDKEPMNTIVTDLDHIEDYVSGQFYKRELPCILKLLDEMKDIPKCIVVDGYVFLDENKKGLGAYLYEALDKKIPIIGVAKSAFRNISSDTYLYRGKSKKPLYITVAGIELEEAKNSIKEMYGKYRFPKLLKEVDSICRA